jgi:hypothetical protein
VVAPSQIDFLDQRSQRRALAAAYRAGYQYQAVLVLGEQLNLRRQAKLGHCRHFTIDDAKSEIVAKPLLHDAGAEAAKRIRVGEVHVAAGSNRLPLGIRQKTCGEPLGVRRRQNGRLEPNGLENAKSSPGGPRAYGEMNVGRT